MNFFLHFGLSDQGNAAQEGKCDEEGEGRKQGGHQGDFAGELMVTAHHLGKSRTGYCRRRADYHKDERQFRAPEGQAAATAITTAGITTRRRVQIVRLSRRLPAAFLGSN